MVFVWFTNGTFDKLPIMQFGGKKPAVVKETVIPDPDYRIPLVLVGKLSPSCPAAVA